MSELTKSWSATQTAKAVRARDISAETVTTNALQVIERLNPNVNAFTDITTERALEEARAVDASLAAGHDLPLAGVPYAVKNLFDIKDHVTRAGSKINRDHPAAGTDAVLVQRLKKAGAVLTGGLNMGEFAYDFTGENVNDGTCRNPHDLSRMTGGSSSGSAAAAASGMVPVTLGSDTNGSIRVPASFCGLFGLKPTFGRLPRTGTFPFVADLDHLGPLARSTEDLALIFDVLQGPEPRDHWQADKSVLPTGETIGRGTEGLRIAIAGGYFRTKGEATAFEAVDRVAKALGVTSEIDIPEAARARAAAYAITAAESSALLFEKIISRPQDFDPDTRDRFISGTMVPSLWLMQAQRFRSWFRELMREIFKSVDILLAPATPFSALKSGTRNITLDGEEMLARPNIGVFTQPISFIGLPVVTVPTWPQGSHLPIGVQVIAPAWREDLALRVAHQLQETGVAQAPVADL